MGTPVWDFGARGTLLGLTRGSGRPEVVRSVLEGVAHRGADLLEAAESDSGFSVEALRVDGGMSENPVFVQALANAVGRPVELAPFLEATTLGRDSWRASPPGPGATRTTWRPPTGPPPSSSPTRTTPPASMTGTVARRPRARREDDPRALGHQLLTPPPPPAAPAGGGGVSERGLLR